MKPFLLLASRAEDDAADAEYAAFLRLCGLEESQLHRVRMEQAPLPHFDLDAYSGIVVGGGPFNASDPYETKSETQRRVEHEVSVLLDEVVARDFPFLGACYGVGTLGVHQGGIVDRRYGESTGAVPISLSETGRADPLFAGMPDVFDAFVGHKEACSVLPKSAVLLASSPSCPVEAFRVKQNLYATQFHPELEIEDMVDRVRIYKNEGYFDASALEETVAAVRASGTVVWPRRILSNFVERYAV